MTQVTRENYWEITERIATMEEWLGQTPAGKTAEESAADYRSDDWLYFINDARSVESTFLRTEFLYNSFASELINHFALRLKERAA